MKLAEICSDQNRASDLLEDGEADFGPAIGGCVELKSSSTTVSNASEALGLCRRSIESKSVRVQGKSSHLIQVLQICAVSLNKKRALTKLGKLTIVDTTHDDHLAELQGIVAVRAQHQIARETRSKK